MNEKSKLLKDIVREVLLVNLTLGKLNGLRNSVHLLKFCLVKKVWFIFRKFHRTCSKSGRCCEHWRSNTVKVTEIDHQGRVNLSRKEAMKEQAEQQAE